MIPNSTEEDRGDVENVKNCTLAAIISVPIFANLTSNLRKLCVYIGSACRTTSVFAEFVTASPHRIQHNKQREREGEI